MPPAFLEWINKCLTISAHPAIKSMKDNWWQDYDLVVNLSDYIEHRLHIQIAGQGIPVYWFPMGETYGMPLENIFGALSILWEAEKNNHKVFMHCMAGRNRSARSTGRRLPECRYRRVSAGHGWTVLFHGNEYPPASRTHHHRDNHRH